MTNGKYYVSHTAGKRMCIREQDSCAARVQLGVYQVIVLGMHRSLLHMHIALRQVADARQGSTFAQESTLCRFRCFHAVWRKWKSFFLSQIADSRRRIVINMIALQRCFLDSTPRNCLSKKYRFNNALSPHDRNLRFNLQISGTFIVRNSQIDGFDRWMS